MRNRHFPRLCRSCQAPMAGQEDSCWRCGAQWASEEVSPTPLRAIAVRRLARAVAELGRADSRRDDDRWTNEGGSVGSEIAALPRYVPSRRGDDDAGFHEPPERRAALTMEAATTSQRSRAEAERQLSAAAERHREIVASMSSPGRPEAGQHVAIKAVARAVGAGLVRAEARGGGRRFLRSARRADRVGAGPGAGGARTGGAPAVVRGAVGATRRRRPRGRPGCRRVRRARTPRGTRAAGARRLRPRGRGVVVSGAG